MSDCKWVIWFYLTYSLTEWGIVNEWNDFYPTGWIELISLEVRELALLLIQQQQKKLLLPAKQSMQIPLTKRSEGNIDFSILPPKPLKSGA